MSWRPWRVVGEPVRGGILAVCDHASNFVPPEVDLGIAPEVLMKHVAWDIGAAGVVERLADEHGIAGFLGEVSRLVADLHREEESTGVVPLASDGHAVPGNENGLREERLALYHRPYHAALGEWLAAAEPALILAVHSFTPRLESGGEQRPWEVGLLYNQDDRAAQLAMAAFGKRGLMVGDNEPYSGRLLNATMNRHAEAFGRPYCAIEIRNDLIRDPAAQARWAALVAEVAREVLKGLRRNAGGRTPEPSSGFAG